MAEAEGRAGVRWGGLRVVPARARADLDVDDVAVVEGAHHVHDAVDAPAIRNKFEFGFGLYI